MNAPAAKRKLVELVDVIRSKNAGPYLLTFDLLFSKRSDYLRVKRSGSIDRELVAGLYGIPPEAVTSIVYFEPAQAIKFTIERPLPAGSVGERDVYGAQQHAPLLELEVELYPEPDANAGEPGC